MAANSKKSTVKPRSRRSPKGRSTSAPPKANRRSAARKAPRAGDWLVYTPDRATLLDFGADLIKVRQRLKRKNVILGNCFLSRMPFDDDEPVELAGIETVSLTGH